VLAAPAFLCFTFHDTSCSVLPTRAAVSAATPLAVAERKHGERAPVTESTISGANWECQELSRQIQTRVAFVDLNLTEATDQDSVFTECTFRRARFNCSRHTGAAFVNCTFMHCSFFETQFTDCKFVGSMFDRCTFDLLQVRGGNWSHVGLPGADLRRAEFAGVRLREADLTGARLDGASLRDADLSGAWLSGANLSRCDLRGSDLSAVEPESVELRDAIVTFEQALVIAAAFGLDVRPE
jgi:uncharacterized protein YjbI with pentapeptide repeats